MKNKLNFCEEIYFESRREEEVVLRDTVYRLSDFRFLAKKRALKDNFLSKTGDFLYFSLTL